MCRLDWRLSLVFMCLYCVGCGDGLVDVRAKVTLDGQPAEAVTVSLISTDVPGNRTAYGTSDQEGNVRFSTYDNFDGVKPGNYKVVASKSPQTDAELEEIMDFDPHNEEEVKRFLDFQARQSAMYVPSMLPPIYGNPDRTPFAITVPVEEQPVIIALESKPTPLPSR